MSGPFRVYVGLVSTGYLVPEAIERSVRAGLAYCGAATVLDRIRGPCRMLVVPDVAMVEPRIARHGSTNPELLRATLAAALGHAPGGSARVLGRSFPGFPASRMMMRAGGGIDRFARRGYYELEDLFPGKVEIVRADRSELFRYQLSKGDVLNAADRRRLLEAGILAAPPRLLRSRLSNELVAPRDFDDADYVVYCPKIKSSLLSQGFSGAVRLGQGPGSGALSDVAACDMLEVCNPDLVVSDGIIAAIGGSQLTQRGHELGVVLAANNALAHDLVAAQILNVDPLRVNHLRIAIERGWGPSSLAQVELGGDGFDAVRQLGQKTKYWDLGHVAIEDFPAKFARDNPSLSFPLEILSGPPYEAAGAHGTMLEYLHLFYDDPALRPRIARWPRIAVCLGRVTVPPTSRLVFAVGDTACETIERITSCSSRLFSLRGRLTLERAQLKDGSRHFLVKARGSPPPLTRLIMAFALATGGAMLPRVLTPSLILDRIVDRLTAWFGPRRPRSQDAGGRLVIASRMPHNAWWALKPVGDEISLAGAPQPLERGVRGP